MRSFVACPRPFHVIDASMEGVGESRVRLLASCTDLEFSETVKDSLSKLGNRLHFFMGMIKFCIFMVLSKIILKEYRQ